MKECATKAIEFTICKIRKVHAHFGGGKITSDAGAMLLGEAEISPFFWQWI